MRVFSCCGVPLWIVAFGCAIMAACNQAPTNQAAPSAQAPSQSPVERGLYLVTVGGCHDCHSPKKMGPAGPELDTSRILSGHPEDFKLPAAPKAAADNPWGVATTLTLTAWSGPWGVSFAANLTPDQNTGLGIWTEQMFMDAIRKGKHMGTSRDILPPMPWNEYAKLTDEDLKAIFAYLRSIPPVTNHVPDPIPPAAPPAAR